MASPCCHCPPVPCTSPSVMGSERAPRGTAITTSASASATQRRRIARIIRGKRRGRITVPSTARRRSPRQPDRGGALLPRNELEVGVFADLVAVAHDRGVLAIVDDEQAVREGRPERRAHHRRTVAV